MAQNGAASLGGTDARHAKGKIGPAGADEEVCSSEH